MQQLFDKAKELSLECLQDLEAYHKLPKDKYNKWLMTGLLDGLEEKFPNKNVSHVIAQVLENQAQHMTNPHWNSKYKNHMILASVRRVMESLFQFQKDSNDAFQIQAMHLPASLVFWEQGDEIHASPITAHSRHSRVRMWNLDEEFDTYLRLDAEYDAVVSFSKKLFEDLQMEIQDDLLRKKEDQQYIFCPYVLIIPNLKYVGELDGMTIRYGKKVV